MDNSYKNISGELVSSLVGTVGGTVGSLITGISDAKKQHELQAKLAKLSLKQQKELEERLQDVQGDVAKMEIIYKTLAIEKNREALVAMNKEKYKGVAILGISLVFLGIVIIIAKTKKS